MLVKAAGSSPLQMVWSAAIVPPSTSLTVTVITAVSAIEMVLKELGANIELGRGIKAAEEVLCK